MAWWVYVLSVYGIASAAIGVRTSILARRMAWLGQKRTKILSMIAVDAVLWLPVVILEGGGLLWERLK